VVAASGSAIEFAPVQEATGPEPGSVLRGWLPAVAVLSGVALHAGLGRPPKAGPSWWPRMAFAAVLLATAGVAAHLPALRWVQPRLYGVEDGQLALQRFIEGSAEALGARGGLTILEIEGVVASVVAVLLLTLAAGGVRAVRRCAATAAPADGAGPTRWGMAAVVLLLVMVFALSVSRKTEGASTLLGGALGLTVILSSTLHRLRTLSEGSGRPFSPTPYGAQWGCSRSPTRWRPRPARTTRS
jgi:hypothetical protein